MRVPGIYLAAILASAAGILLIDRRWRLAAWRHPGRTAAAVLLGTALPEQLEACVERPYVGEIRFLALVCADERLRARLLARPPWRESLGGLVSTRSRSSISQRGANQLEMAGCKPMSTMSTQR